MSYFIMYKFPFAINIELKHKYTILYDRLGYDTVTFTKLMRGVSKRKLSTCSDLPVVYVNNLEHLVPEEGILFIVDTAIAYQAMSMLRDVNCFVVAVSRREFIDFQDVETFDLMLHRNHIAAIPRR